MILEVWKPYGITSVQFIKQFKLKHNFSKITCTGRLDPLAQGTLILLTDDDTKQMQSFLKSDKKYKFDLILGISTESHDCLAKIVDVKNTNQIHNNFIISKLEEFITNYTIQKFPLVSSFVVKHDSIKKPLWWFYQNGYRNISLPEKPIKIYSYNIFDIQRINGNKLAQLFQDRINTIQDEKLQIDLNTHQIINQWKNFKEHYNEFIVIPMELDVSTGFYIRRFCHDFGDFIDLNGIAFDITRIKIIQK